MGSRPSLAVLGSLTLGGAALAQLALASCSGSGDDEPPRCAILITLDTTRADVLVELGGRPGVAPHLERLRADSELFSAARTVAPLTLPAHASMLTGLWPPRSGVRNNGPARLPRSAATLAELASEAGYETAAFIAALALDRAFGIQQGFEVWDQPEVASGPGARAIGERPAQEVVAAARSWLAARDPERPFFLWVHLFDPHAPYEPPAAFLEQAGGDPYLGEVAAMDAALGELLDDLEGRGLLERSALLVVGDHGEGLGDHGEATHSVHCYDTTLRVPMLLRRPAGRGAGQSCGALVSAVDVTPTLLEALGLPIPAGLDGLSLWSAESPPDRGLYFESYYGWYAFGLSPLAGWIDAGGKYLHSSRPQFFRPDRDPGEQRDLAAGAGAELGRYRDAIATVAARPALAPDGIEPVDSELLAALADLGYVTTDDLTTPLPHPLEPGELLAPADGREQLELFRRASELAQAGRGPEAVELLEALVAENPRNTSALELLAAQRVAAGEVGRAVELLVQRLRLPPEKIATHRELVRCYSALGEREAARRHHLRSLELLVAAHERRGETEEADFYRSQLAEARIAVPPD